jgi:hypothetical protein
MRFFLVFKVLVQLSLIRQQRFGLLISGHVSSF